MYIFLYHIALISVFFKKIFAYYQIFIFIFLINTCHIIIAFI